MKKNSSKKTSPREKTMDSIALREEPPENFRDETNLMENPQPDTSQNWSQPEDRSEDLITETDPFTQQPEKNTQIPPELVQKRAYHLYEQRGSSPDGNLADWFEAERQLRQETGKR